MPGPVTHMYVAMRIAQEYAGSGNDTLKRVSDGCHEWLDANIVFRNQANTALNNRDPDEFLAAIGHYRQALTTDNIAIFGAYSAGSSGPDLWVFPYNALIHVIDMGILGTKHFDLGHYNLSHRFPYVVLNRIFSSSRQLDPLQRQYQTAYIFGYLTHIALDVLGHVMVNTTAGAYNAIAKEWENDQGNLTRDLFNLHAKSEHYLDAFVRHVLFEGYHQDLAGFNSVRASHFGQSDPMFFPNGRDHYLQRCQERFAFLSPRQTGDLTDALQFLDLSTSLPGPFSHRYDRPFRFPQRVTPFIHHDYLQAYDLCVDRIRNDDESITHLSSESVKTEFFKFDNRDLSSFDYYLNFVIPDYAKFRDRVRGLLCFEGWGRFFEGARTLAHRFIDDAVSYLGSGDLSQLSILRHWNLDVGLRYKIVDQSAEKPDVPVRIDLVHVLKDVPELANWQPYIMDWKTWGQGKKLVDWDDKPTKQPHYNDSDYDSLSGASGEKLDGIVFPQSGIELSVAAFKLYKDDDELAAYIFGQQHSYQLGQMGFPAVLTEVYDSPNHHPGYSLPFCYEDFLENDDDTKKEPPETIGSITLQTYKASFRAPVPASIVSQSGEVITSNFLMQEKSRPLPRHIKISTARKYVCHAQPQDNSWYNNDEGNFHPDKLDVFSMPFLTEEMAFALYAVVLRSGRYFDLFSHSEYDAAFLEQCKHIHSVGVNLILLIFDEVTGATPDDIRLTLKEAYIDGEGETVTVENAPPPNIIRLFEIEDALFRSDSAVFLPEPVAHEPEEDEHTGETEEQERISGIEMLKCVMIHAKEHSTEKMLITGHTDTCGQPSYNDELSGLRAESLLHLLLGEETDKEEWAKLCHGRHKKEDQLQLLAWAAAKKGYDCDPEGKTFYAAVLAFQKAYNSEYKPEPLIGEDGDWKKQTWGAFFTIYQDELAKSLDTDANDLSTYRSALQWLDGNMRAIGCGENWPIEHIGEDEYECPANRRVEILFYEPGTEPQLPLGCHPGGKKCDKATCAVYGGNQPQREHLPAHPESHPQSTPLIYAPTHPGSDVLIPLDGFYVYIAYYAKGKDTPRIVVRSLSKDGHLLHPITLKPIAIDGDCEAWFYFSNRDDLYVLDQKTAFCKDSSGLPLVGPVNIPAGENKRIDIDMWKQNDWIVVLHESVGNSFADEVFMAEWNEKTPIGEYLKDGTFRIFREYRKHDSSQKWKSGSPLPLVKCENGTKWIWAGTMSYAATSKVKILFLHKKGDERIYAGSINEIEKQDVNIILDGHHKFNSALVQQLTAIAADSQNTSLIDALPEPPERFILPGDICWESQGQTNFCGTYSFAAAMNYWYPFTSNAIRNNGAFYSAHPDISHRLDGSLTPDDVISGVNAFHMHGRDNDAEEIDRAHAIKLVKLWLSAGIPVLILVAENAPETDLHWKVLAGYDGDRIFMNNSGFDREKILSRRTNSIDYETAPIGNDVDSQDAFYEKWNTIGFFQDKVTSCDQCTFIPVYPQEVKFAGTVPC